MDGSENFPLLIEQISDAGCEEWRVGDTLPERLCENWQMVYLFSGMVEEHGDSHTVILRAGQLLFHRPGETVSMRAVGEVPPEVLRVSFACSGSAMDELYGRPWRIDLTERLRMRQIAAAVRDLFVPSEEAGALPVRRVEPPFGAEQALCYYLGLMLIQLVRARRRTRRLSARARQERDQQALVDHARVYFSKNLSRELTAEEVCQALGVSRARLQKAFRARLRRGPMETFAAMKMERAKELLAAGCTPGEAAERLGFADGAYFSRCFRRSEGMSPREFLRKLRPADAKTATNRHAAPSNVHVIKPGSEVE